MENQERACLDCEKTLRGRIDKKFCDDHCRNNYNNRQNSEQTNYVRNINNSLKRNRRILQELLGPADETVKVKREKLIEKGFQFSYHTHTYLNQKQQTYFFCYEYGHLLLDEGLVLIVKTKVAPVKN